MRTPEKQIYWRRYLKKQIRLKEQEFFNRLAGMGTSYPSLVLGVADYFSKTGLVDTDAIFDYFFRHGREKTLEMYPFGKMLLDAFENEIKRVIDGQ